MYSFLPVWMLPAGGFSFFCGIGLAVPARAMLPGASSSVAAKIKARKPTNNEAGPGKNSLTVIPNEVRNLSRFRSKDKEGFLGTRRASESRHFELLRILSEPT